MIRSTFACLVLVMAFGDPASAASFYLNPALGKDTNDGSMSSPWKTMNKVIISVMAGDVVNVRGGTYTEDQYYDPASSAANSGYLLWLPTNALGAPAKPIIIQSAPGEQAIFDGGGGPYFLYFYGNNNTTYFGYYVMLRGLEFRNYAGIALRGDLGAKNIAIDGCTFKTFSDLTTGAVSFMNSSNIIVRNSRFENIGISGSTQHALYIAEGSSEVLLENNSIQGVSGYGIHGYGHEDFTRTTRNFIVRRNTVANSRSIHLILSGTNYENIYVYNNTFFSTHNPYPSRDGLDTVRSIDLRGGPYKNLEIKNNLSYAPLSEVSVYAPRIQDFVGLYFDYNLLFNTNNNSRLFNWGGTIFGLADFTQLTSFAQNSLNQDPKFTNVAAMDFSLLATSPAVDRGTFLTETTASGTGRNIPLKNARYFIDGFGIIPGDTIQLGSQSAGIVNVDYVQNRITIDRDISWNGMQGVALKYSGLKPDIGAYEFTNATAPQKPTGLRVL